MFVIKDLDFGGEGKGTKSADGDSGGVSCSWPVGSCAHSVHFS